MSEFLTWEQLLFNNNAKFVFFVFDLKKILAYLLIILSKSSVYIIGLWRTMVLGILYLIGPVTIAMSINPFFGTIMTFRYFLLVFKLSCWSIVLSISHLLMFTFTENTYSKLSFFDVDSIEYMVLMFVYFWCTINVPYLTKLIFNLNNFDFSTTPLSSYQKLLTYIPIKK